MSHIQVSNLDVYSDKDVDTELVDTVTGDSAYVNKDLVGEKTARMASWVL